MSRLKINKLSYSISSSYHKDDQYNTGNLNVVESQNLGLCLYIILLEGGGGGGGGC